MKNPNQTPNRKTHPQLEDAEEDFYWKVEYAHCKGSTVADPHNCAGARAIREVDGVTDAWLLVSYAYIEFADGRLLRYEVPKKTEMAIDEFDHTSGFYPPGTYRLAPPCKTHRLDYPKRRHESNRDGSKPEFSKPRIVRNMNIHLR